MGLRSDRSGSKTCTQSDPYHDRHRSQALACQYLQRLLSENLKDTDTLLIAHPPTILPSSFAQDAIQPCNLVLHAWLS